MKPYTCPVCRGDGEVRSPVLPLAEKPYQQLINVRKCHPCKGEGVLWGPMDEVTSLTGAVRQVPNPLSPNLDPDVLTIPASTTIPAIGPSTTLPVGNPNTCTIGHDEHGQPVTISGRGALEAPPLTEEWLESALAEMRAKNAECAKAKQAKATYDAVAHMRGEGATVPQTAVERLEAAGHPIPMRKEVITQGRRSGMTLDKEGVVANRGTTTEGCP